MIYQKKDYATNTNLLSTNSSGFLKDGHNVNRQSENSFYTTKTEDKISCHFPKEIQLKSIEYYFEMLFWGLRKIKYTKKSNLKHDKLYIQVAMGVDKDGNENIYTSKKCERFRSNDNFIELRHQRFTVKLPEQDEYKPYLNIRCLSQGQFDISNELVKSYIELTSLINSKVKKFKYKSQSQYIQ